VQRAVSRGLLIAMILIEANTLAWSQDLEKGRIELLSKCAKCHRDDGKGAGRTSSTLKTKPADLTVFAKKNKGVYSPDAAAKTIDGRRTVQSHRKGEMPIWGCRQGPYSLVIHRALHSLTSVICH
jgi:mono/diheme cytochrome c family protein